VLLWVSVGSPRGGVSSFGGGVHCVAFKPPLSRPLSDCGSRGGERKTLLSGVLPVLSSPPLSCPPLSSPVLPFPALPCPPLSCSTLSSPPLPSPASGCWSGVPGDGEGGRGVEKEEWEGYRRAEKEMWEG
ncbi:hypothetical protein Pmani_033704, partial [Petrolisthes manimaculis]